MNYQSVTDLKQKVRSFVLSLFNKVKTEKVEAKDYLIATLTPEAMIILNSISDIHFRYPIAYVAINPSELKHIFDRHYGENEKATHQGHPLTDTEIESIVDILDHPDKIIALGYIKKHQAETYLFLKRQADSTLVVVEIFGSKNNKLRLKTMYNSVKSEENIIKDELKSLLNTSDNASRLLAQRVYDFNSSSNAKVQHLLDFTKYSDK
ncbi:hypothetical protein RCZ04_00580 [Capnocytophaga sp. HP1101]